MGEALSSGYHAVPRGRIATIVTCLEMREKPPPRAIQGDVAELKLARVDPVDQAWYLGLYGAIGRDLLWFSRLRMRAEELRAILSSPDVEVYALRRDGRDEGFLELDFREAGQCELAFFGLTPTMVGGSAGRLMMNAAIERAFSRPIARFWVHTCTFDHPKALPFYIRSGFSPYERMVEITDDPRLTGELPADAAPFMPVI
jgi:GNAT superfamily N-acetyltransferase